MPIDAALAIIIVVFLFGIGVYISYRWAKSYELTIAAMQEFIPIPATWAYLLMLPFFNLVWIFFLNFFIVNALKKMHTAGTLSKVDSSLLPLTIAMLVFDLSCLIAPALGIISVIFCILTWIKVVEIRKHIISK